MLSLLPEGARTPRLRGEKAMKSCLLLTGLRCDTADGGEEETTSGAGLHSDVLPTSGLRSLPPGVPTLP